MVPLYLVKLYHYIGIIYISKYFQYKKAPPGGNQKGSQKRGIAIGATIQIYIPNSSKMFSAKNSPLRLPCPWR